MVVAANAGSPAERVICYNDVPLRSRIFFSYVNPLLKLAATGCLQQEDVQPLAAKEDEPEALAECFYRNYESAKAAYTPRPGNSSSAVPSRRPWITYTGIALLRLYRWSMLLESLWALAEVARRLGTPVALRQFLRWLQAYAAQESPPQWQGWVWAVVLGACGYSTVITSHQMFWIAARIGFSMSQQTTAAIHRKVLRLNSAAISKFSIGFVINLASNDVRRFDDAMPYWVFLWAGPLELSMILLMVSLELDFLSALAGVATSLAMIPLQSALVRYIGGLRRNTARCTDERVRLAGEVVEGALAMKMLGWEDPLEHQLRAIRSREASFTRRIQRIRGINFAMQFCITPIVAFVTFAVYRTRKGSLDIPSAFYALSLLYLPKMSMLNFFVLAVQTLTELRVSLQRIDNFLAITEPRCPATVAREEAMRHAREEAARQRDGSRSIGSRRMFSCRTGPASMNATSRSSSMTSVYNVVQPLSRQISNAIGRGLDLMMRLSMRFRVAPEPAVQRSAWTKWQSGYVAMRGADYAWSRPLGFATSAGFESDCEAAEAGTKDIRHPRQQKQQSMEKVRGGNEHHVAQKGCGPVAEATIRDETSSGRCSGEERIQTNSSEAATSHGSGQVTPRGSVPAVPYSSGTIPVSDPNPSDTLADDVSEVFEEAETRDEVTEGEVEKAGSPMVMQSNPGEVLRPASGGGDCGGGGGGGGGKVSGEFSGGDNKTRSDGLADGATDTGGSCSGGLTLYGIRFAAAPGELVGICGSVGSGKSSLLAALLGEIQPLNAEMDGKDAVEEVQSGRRRTDGRVERHCGAAAAVGEAAFLPECSDDSKIIGAKGLMCRSGRAEGSAGGGCEAGGTGPVVCGRVAFCSQIPYIVAGSIRDNILFGAQWDDQLYERVIHACCLTDDLTAFAGGDLTELGERGANLSGGQKARVALARACYARPEVALLDDPLSAVDPRVGQDLFARAIGPGGLLDEWGCTRLLVTHQRQYLPKCDRVLVLRGGRLVSEGPWRQLVGMRLPELTAGHGGLMGQVAEGGGGKVGQEGQQPAAEVEEEREGPSVDEALAMCRTSASAVDETGEPAGTMEGGKLVQSEDRAVGAVPWSVYGNYCRHMGLLTTLAILTAMVLGQGVFMLAEWWLSRWARADIHNQQKIRWLWVYGMLTGIVIILAFVRSAIFFEATMTTATSIHNSMARRVLHAPLSFFHTNPSGRIANRFTKDQGQVDDLLPLCLFDALQSIFPALGAIILISLAVPVMLPVILVLAIVFYWVRRRYITASRDIKRWEAVTRSPIFTCFSTNIKGLPTIRGYDAADNFHAAFLKLMAQNGSWSFSYHSLSRWIGVRLDAVAGTILLVTSLLAMAMRDRVKMGGIALALTQTVQMTGLMQWVVRRTAEVENTMTSVERMLSYTELPSEGPRVAEGGGSPPPGWPKSGALTYEHVTAAYRPGLPPVLRDLSFSLAPGTSCGVVGRTGSGKSSLMLTLFRLIDVVHGRILLDGMDTAAVGLGALRRQLAIIPQDPVLFSGTLRSNLDPWGAHGDEALWEVLQAVQLRGAVAAMPGGLDAAMAECGSNLSVGQRQLFCLARALLQDAKVLALDEPTANVDRATDQLIQSTLRDFAHRGRETQGRVLLLIAHRLDTILDTDHLLVLAAGQLVESGRPGELIAQGGGVFAGMAAAAHVGAVRSAVVAAGLVTPGSGTVAGAEVAGGVHPGREAPAALAGPAGLEGGRLAWGYDGEQTEQG